MGLLTIWPQTTEDLALGHKAELGCPDLVQERLYVFFIERRIMIDRPCQKVAFKMFGDFSLVPPSINPSSSLVFYNPLSLLPRSQLDPRFFSRIRLGRQIE